MIRTLNALIAGLDRAAPPVLASLARFAFAAVLAVYYWASALTKIDGFSISVNGYAQIFPKAMEAANYNVGEMTVFHTLVVAAGTLAEFILPALLIVGFATRPAALGMISFVVVQTLTDLFGHGALGQPETLGAWFDRVPDSLIMDHRLLWVTLLMIPLLHGGGPLSIDRLLSRRIS